MKYHFRFLLFFLLIFGNRVAAVSVRILLDEKENDAPTWWVVESPQGIELINQRRQTSKKKYNKLLIEHRAGAIYLNDRRCPFEQIKCRSVGGHITCDDQPYHGSLLFVIHEGMLLLISVVDLEDYLFSVLRTESWPGWPLEVNKVFAIASRSYALAKMAEAKKHKKPYHMVNTNKHQTYSGAHSSLHLRDAVEQTRHTFLAYEQKPILAMFDSCCAGAIPAHMQSIAFDKAPYLARKQVCTFCQGCKIFNWKARYSDKELVSFLNDEFDLGIKKIKNVTVKYNEKAGIVDTIVINHADEQETVLPVKKLYSALKKIKSYIFDIEHKGHTFTFLGKGYGHHIGLCQWGARSMVTKGWGYKKILQFYYPGTELMHLKS